MNETLGKYELIEQIGRGGYGTVYRARETVLDVPRAVKVLHAALVADPEFIERFRREARLAARLEHPHIVPVYELGQEDGHFYLVMKYMGGGSLKEALSKQGRIPFEQAAAILDQIASALGYAHDQTEKHNYTPGVYDCSQFSRDVHNNAEAAGIRAAVVHVDFRNRIEGHALNAFLTTDYGLVYVDCTRIDTIARVKTGKEFRAIDLYKITGIKIRNDYWWSALSSYYYIRSSTGGHSVTESIRIYW